MAWWLLIGGLALAEESRPAPVETLIADELARAWHVLEDEPDPPHYASVAVEDRWRTTVNATDGVVATSESQRERSLDVDLRVGTATLDSTHALRGLSAMEEDERERIAAPLDEGWALRQAVWREVDQAYRQGRERLIMLRANQSVKAEEEDPAPDFEPRSPIVDRREVPVLTADRAAWEPVLAEVSARLGTGPHTSVGSASLAVSRVVKTFVDTEGTRLVHGGTLARVSLSASAQADDGDEIQVFRAVDVHDPASLPARDALLAAADEVVAELERERAAPRGDPYSGPVLLRGRAAAVFFHEVMGHRVEGHRQKSDEEGKTFADSIGKPVLPTWLSVVDDPTITHLAGEDLNGFYAYDDEGVAAGRAVVVDQGVFTGFLMSRSPITGFEHSNGHGRRMTGRWPRARMANTIVENAKPVPEAELRKQLIDLVKKQGLPYGYIVDEIDGGFTLTGRVMPNAFNVRANATWRVYANGRPDERVRGIDLVGTPFAAFANIVAAGDDPAVFNGACGAESGWVPVSGVSPSILFSRLEFQLKEKGEERPPLLPKPSTGPAAGGTR
jgi:predicted Zn-dependent protease